LQGAQRKVRPRGVTPEKVHEEPLTQDPETPKTFFCQEGSGAEHTTEVEKKHVVGIRGEKKE